MGTADRKRAAGTQGNAVREWVGVVAQAHDAPVTPDDSTAAAFAPVVSFS